MADSIPTLESLIDLDLRKTITFKRLPLKHVSGYKIYGEFKDSNYTSGVRRELIETIDNPPVPNVKEKTIDLPYNQDATWKLPDDAYLDRDHSFYMRLTNGQLTEQLGSMYLAFNRITKLITLDTVAKDYNESSKVQLTYFQDLIARTYICNADCKILVVPIFVDSYTYGSHNVII